MPDERQTTAVGIADAAKTPSPYPWISIGIGSAAAGGLLAISLALVVHFMMGRLVDLREPTAVLGDALHQTLRNQGVPAGSIQVLSRELRKDGGAIFYFTRVEVDVPQAVNADGLESVIERSLWHDNIVIAGVESDVASRVLHLTLGPADVGSVVLHGVSGKTSAAQEPATTPAVPLAAKPVLAESVRAPVPTPVLREWTPPLEDATLETAVARRTARVAIILDDGGYGGPQVDVILGLDPDVTLAILPYTPQGTELAERAAGLGFEVMLHMPMENVSDTLRHEGQLNVGMTPDEIDALTRAALAQVPHAVGVNNHMGSKFTAEADAMGPFLDWVKTSGLYFVDSGTTAQSVAYRAAHERGIPSAARTLFLDNVDEPEAIRARLLELVEMAQQQGEAIGIGHFRLNTATALAEMLPQFSSMGVELVRASELVR